MVNIPLMTPVVQCVRNEREGALIPRGWAATHWRGCNSRFAVRRLMSRLRRYVVGASAAFGTGTCQWRQRFWTQTFWQLAVSTVPTAVIALRPTMSEPIHWSTGLVLILAYNWIVATALGYFLWNKILTMMSAAVVGQVLALTPVGGYLLSSAIFGGAVSGDVVVSIVLIVAGIILTLRR
jgi:drug/metabolite transporter (DMT)-like permease